MGDEGSRKTILARRAYFVAAALAAAGIGAAPACSGDTEQEKSTHDGGDAEPQPCLKFAPDSSFEDSPEPCLGMRAPDAEADAEPDAGQQAVDASDADAEPQPCLTPNY